MLLIPMGNHRLNTNTDRPLIGVPTAELPGLEEGEPGIWAMRSSYVEPILALGGLPILLPQVSTITALSPLLSRLSGLLLAGGHDIHPELYGKEPQSELERTDQRRDQSELLITRWAIERHVPILGICRGMQMVNLATGGSLIQDIGQRYGSGAVHRDTPANYNSLTEFGHFIDIEPSSRIYTLIGETPTWVNSMHHQCVDELGQGLVITARSSDDGIIEVLESANDAHWFIGLQGHPEALINQKPWVAQLYQDFLSAAYKFSHANQSTGNGA